MKAALPLFLSLMSVLPAAAEFSSWTNKEGQAAKLDLTGIALKDGELAGKFKMGNGKSATIKKSELSQQDATRLQEWAPPMTGEASVFDEILWGNLVSLQGDHLHKTVLSRKPAKYYIFYYTASWCGPCQRFTPSLVEWYNKNKNDNFEIFLISSDRNEQAMEGYAVHKKMPWPHLAFPKIGAFKQQFREKHAVSGIPSLIVCDREGKVLGNFRSQLPQLGEMVK